MIQNLTRSAVSEKFVKSYTPESAHKLDEFLQYYANTDFANIQNLKEKCVSSFNWQNYFNNPETYRILILAYQRLAKLSPEKDMKVIHLLFKNGIHSAIQISAMARSSFYSLFDELKLDTCNIPEKIYENALKQRDTVNLLYLNHLQKNEPYYKNARFNKVRNRNPIM